MTDAGPGMQPTDGGTAPVGESRLFVRGAGSAAGDLARIQHGHLLMRYRQGAFPERNDDGPSEQTLRDPVVRVSRGTLLIVVSSRQ